MYRPKVIMIVHCLENKEGKDVNRYALFTSLSDKGYQILTEKLLMYSEFHIKAIKKSARLLYQFK